LEICSSIRIAFESPLQLLTSEPIDCVKMKLAIPLAALFAAGSVLAADSRGDPRNVANALYKNPRASVDDRVDDLLWRMTVKEKVAQIVQGDLRNWMNLTDNTFNYTGLVWSMEYRAGTFYVGFPPAEWDWVSQGIKRAQDYLVQNTTLGIPAITQTEGIHGLLAINATIFNSPIAQACSFNPGLIEKMGAAIAQESLALGINQMFAPLADLARELRFGRVEETYGEDSYLAGEMAYSYVKGLQATKQVSAMVKHFAAFASPEQGNLMPSPPLLSS
jgi:beta-glucosidase